MLNIFDKDIAKIVRYRLHFLVMKKFSNVTYHPSLSVIATMPVLGSRRAKSIKSRFLSGPSMASFTALISILRI